VTPLARRVSAVLVALCLALGLASGTAGGAEDPCAAPEAKTLLCPNLRIGPPHDLYVQHAGGRVRLRATSDVRSRGRGPIELRGSRNGWHSMRTRQRIYRVGGGHIDLPSRATLHFTDVGAYFGGSYWKVHQLARFELWSVDSHRRLLHRVRAGPKLNYCLRDLERTRAGRRSPNSRHYPGCNQNPYEDHVTLAPRSAGRTSTPPTTTSSGSASAACAAASPS
jgi:hypothetical protein